MEVLEKIDGVEATFFNLNTNQEEKVKYPYNCNNIIEGYYLDGINDIRQAEIHIQFLYSELIVRLRNV